MGFSLHFATPGHLLLLPLLLHPNRTQAGSNLADLRRFVDYALAKPDVYLVTMRQLIGELRVELQAGNFELQAGRFGAAARPVCRLLLACATTWQLSLCATRPPSLPPSPVPSQAG